MQSGELWAVIGASRGGKSQFLFKHLAKASRLLVWDVADEYQTTYKARNRAQLAALLERFAGKRARISYIPDDIEDFDFFCRVARVWVDSQAAAGQRSALVFEETADVTSPGKAPAQYGIILRRYLRYGVDIYAVTQRPAESDKTALNNAGKVYVTQIQGEDDQRTVSRRTRVPMEVISSMVKDRDNGIFDWISVNTGTQKYQRGRLTFPNDRPKFAKTGAEVAI